MYHPRWGTFWKHIGRERQMVCYTLKTHLGSRPLKPFGKGAGTWQVIGWTILSTAIVVSEQGLGFGSLLPVVIPKLCPRVWYYQVIRSSRSQITLVTVNEIWDSLLTITFQQCYKNVKRSLSSRSLDSANIWSTFRASNTTPCQTELSGWNASKNVRKRCSSCCCKQRKHSQLIVSICVLCMFPVVAQYPTARHD